jgi:hypothetical protein
MVYKALPRFDRENDFRVERVITVAGNKLAPGDTFDKTLVTVRTLRQLYEQRKLSMHEPKGNGHGAGQPVMPDFGSIPDEALRIWLREHNVVSRPNAKHETLVQRAQNVWKKLYYDEPTNEASHGTEIPSNGRVRSKRVNKNRRSSREPR